jgi:hypothetical protein
VIGGPDMGAHLLLLKWLMMVMIILAYDPRPAAGAGAGAEADVLLIWRLSRSSSHVLNPTSEEMLLAVQSIS